MTVQKISFIKYRSTKILLDRTIGTMEVMQMQSPVEGLVMVA